MSWSDGEIKWAGLIFALLTTFTYGTYIVALNAVELQFHITSTFELFKDHFVHFGTGIYKRRSNCL